MGKPWGKRGGSLGEAGGKRGGSHMNHLGFYRSVGGKRVRPVWPCIILEGASEETVGLLGTTRAEGLGLEAQRDSGRAVAWVLLEFYQALRSTCARPTLQRESRSNLHSPLGLVPAARAPDRPPELVSRRSPARLRGPRRAPFAKHATVTGGFGAVLFLEMMQIQILRGTRTRL